jgi:hypothetical protein
MKNRKLFLSIVPGILLLIFLPMLETSTIFLPIVFAPEARTLPAQGLYDSCVAYDPACMNHLDLFDSAGFRLVLNYGTYYDRTRSLIAYANRAQSLGMKIIWSTQYRPEMGVDSAYLIKKYPDLAGESGCLDNTCFVRYVVNLVKNHPATWGYYVADEVGPLEHDKMKYYTDLIKSTDPNHPRLFVISGSYEMEQYFTFPSFMADLTDVYAPDVYPYGFRVPGDQFTDLTGIVADHTRYWSGKIGLRGAVVLQAFNGTRYNCYSPPCTFPTYQQMKDQRDQAIQYSSPEFILWWTFDDILKEGTDWQSHWRDLVAAAFSSPPAGLPQPTPNRNTCPFGWKCEDIGNPQIEGSQSLDNHVWMVDGAGWDISSASPIRADQFRFVYQSLPADGRISARVISFNGTSSRAKAGLMLRKTFDPTAPYYAVYLTPGGKVRVQYRKAIFENTYEATVTDLSLPIYIRILRIGQTYSAFTSKDGGVWTLLPNSTVTLASLNGSLMAGLAVTSGDEANLKSAGFDGLFLIPNLSNRPANESITQ